MQELWEIAELREVLEEDDFLGKDKLLEELKRVSDDIKMVAKFPRLRYKLVRAFEEEIKHSHLNFKRCIGGPWEKYWSYRRDLFERAVHTLLATDEEIIWLGYKQRYRPELYISLQATKYGFNLIRLYLGATITKTLNLRGGRVRVGIRNLRYDDKGRLRSFEFVIKPSPKGEFALVRTTKGASHIYVTEAIRETLGRDFVEYLIAKINGTKRLPAKIEDDTIIALVSL